MTQSNDVEFAISCGIYLRGETLDPAAITAQLGIEPTASGRMGDVRSTSAGREMTLRTGYWKYVVKADSTSFEPAIDEALAAFDAVAIELTSLPGVADAFFDIFGAGDRTEESDGGDFSLSARQIARMAALNLSLEVSFSIIAADGNDVHSRSTALPNPGTTT